MTKTFLHKWKPIKQYFDNNAHKYNDSASQYALSVFNNQIVTSQYVRYACMRHLLFLYKQEHEPTFPFVYIPAYLDQLQEFASTIIVPEIKKPFIFLPFRKFIAGFVFGWVYKNNTSRLITKEVFDAEARKQWKSSFWAMVMLAVSLGLLKDGNPQIYIAGPQKSTSKIPYDIAHNYIIQSPKLRKQFAKNNTIRILSKKRGLIKHLAFEKRELEGTNPSMVVLTEYHLHKDDTMQESAKSSNNLSRLNQLIVYDTTKGKDIDGVCYKREYSYKTYLHQQILDPDRIHENFDIFIWIAELDEQDYSDWQNPDLWIKANPGLGHTVSLESLLSEYHKISSSASRIEFQTKRLGMWIGAASSYFSYDDIIQSNKQAGNAIQNAILSDFKGYNAVVGIDLASNVDNACVALNFEIPQDDGESVWAFKNMGFIPKATILEKEKMDKVDYRDWEKRGFITPTPGDIIDYKKIEQYVKDLQAQYSIRGVAYDPWRFEVMRMLFFNSNMFHEDELVQVRQGTKLSPYFLEFERKLRLKKVYFFDNFYTFSNIMNTAIRTSTFSENIYPVKINSYKRIDAVIAMLNSIALRVNVPAINVKGKAFWIA